MFLLAENLMDLKSRLYPPIILLLHLLLHLLCTHYVLSSNILAGKNEETNDLAKEHVQTNSVCK